ncbi:hypothetical protein [Lutimaribacter saemankumensis]|uniref:hypothetical protein n=1 Tax=Lutimaribacter saemankumensis TaxID=490829 RepID=UPI001FE0157A|nr:hypothetical protein [Lutimaribacter saemankumensis]
MSTSLLAKRQQPGQRADQFDLKIAVHRDQCDALDQLAEMHARFRLNGRIVQAVGESPNFCTIHLGQGWVQEVWCILRRGQNVRQFRLARFQGI